MAFEKSLAPKRTRSRILKKGSFSRARAPSQAPPRAPPQPATSTNFEANFCNEGDKAKFECSYAKRKIQEIRTIKIADFVEAKFKYLECLRSLGGCPT